MFEHKHYIGAREAVNQHLGVANNLVICSKFMIRKLLMGNIKQKRVCSECSDLEEKSTLDGGPCAWVLQAWFLGIEII